MGEMHLTATEERCDLDRVGELRRHSVVNAQSAQGAIGEHPPDEELVCNEVDRHARADQLDQINVPKVIAGLKRAALDQLERPAELVSVVRRRVSPSDDLSLVEAAIPQSVG
jgi:hypothetical protein